MYCSPSGDNDRISCLKIDHLRNIGHELVRLGYPISDTFVDKCQSKQELFNELAKYINKETKCQDELCWTSTDLVKKKIKNVNELFVPIMPDSWRQKPEEWLNTMDIDSVMEQYSKANSDFHFAGTVPIDFDLKSKDGYCEVSDICQISIPQLYKKGVRKIGFVFNTDPSSKSGEHWISTFIDLGGIRTQELLGGAKKRRKTKRKSRQRNKVKGTKDKVYGMYFFDSTSNPPPKQIEALHKRLNKQCKKINKKLDFFENDIQHQFGNNECGVYCLYFLSNMIKNRNFFNIIEDIKKDKEMHEFRKVFYRPR